METYRCNKCQQDLPRESFCEGINKPYRCKTCDKVYRQINKNKVREYQLQYKFKISLEDYNRKLVEQNGVCAICGKVDKTKQLAVDHCHTTGKVRGLLCSHCNQALGHFRDSINVVKSALEYLKKYGTKPN